MPPPSPAGSPAMDPAPGPPSSLPRLATPDDVPRLVRALADAFMDDPVYTWMLPAGRRHAARLRALFTAELEQYGLRQGSVWTNPGCDGAVVAMAPGNWEMPTSMPLREAFVWMRAFGRRLSLAATVQRALEQGHPDEPHCYVRIVGVRSARQGRGLGSALMRPMLEQADRSGLPAYIEASSERSAALYARLGFVHLGAVDLPQGGPPIWPMRRPAAPAPTTTA
jgi:GNAT superfamily N-acetyltransferase